MTRQELITEIRNHYNRNRLKEIDRDYLAFEEEMATIEDLELILKLTDQNAILSNDHNSCLLYATGLTAQFDFKKERCDTVGGSPPDKYLTH